MSAIAENTDSDDSDPPMNILDTVIDIISDFSGWVDMTDVVYMVKAGRAWGVVSNP